MSPLAVSPDGHRIAIVAMGADGKSQLWVRSLDTLAAQALAGTEGAFQPFWSPDSRFIGFFAGGKLKKIEVSGGPPITLCDAPDPRAGTWNRDGVIVFAPTSPRLSKECPRLAACPPQPLRSATMRPSTCGPSSCPTASIFFTARAQAQEAGQFMWVRSIRPNGSFCSTPIRQMLSIRRAICFFCARRLSWRSHLTRNALY